MAKRRRGRPAAPTPDPEQPIDVVRIGQGIGNFETINGLPQGILTAALAVIAILLIRPIIRGLRAFLRG
jgi:hypothetical protein